MIEIKDGKTLASLIKEMAQDINNITHVKWEVDVETFLPTIWVTFKDMIFKYDVMRAKDARLLVKLTIEEEKDLRDRFDQLQKRSVDAFAATI